MSFKPPPSVGLGNLGTSWNLGDHKIRDALGGLLYFFLAARQWPADKFWGFDGFARGARRAAAILKDTMETLKARDIAAEMPVESRLLYS
jgi:hypothetical protein